MPRFLDSAYQVLQVGTALAAIGGTVFYFRFKASIQRRKNKLKEKLARGLVYRDTVSKPDRVIKMLELSPSFVKAHESSWQMCSLGEYLSTLRFFTDSDDGKDESSSTAKIFEKELYVIIASVMMRALGDTVGPLLLPLLGMKPAESIFEKIASKIVSYIVAEIFVKSSTEQDWDPTKDMAAFPLNVSEITSFINLNQKLADGNMEESPITWMQRGEIAYDPTFAIPSTPEGGEAEDILVPNPFVIEDHYEAAIFGMEEKIRSSQREQGGEATYDPDDRSYPEPTPINRVILPDLYLGWGDAKATHTKREVLRNRLFAVLLTKLSHNYDLRKKGQDDDFFVVRMNGIDCTFPDEFLKVLCDAGHSIEVCPRSCVTTFGMAVCVKEADGSWTNVPIALFCRTGYESRRQRPASFHMLHGGIDLTIKGPLIGVDERTGLPNKCDLQFYMAIEGMCGWHSNHNVDAPWMEQVSTSSVYDQEQALAAVRMSGILACVLNQIGTEMDLPFGGYGVLGVCNDTAALVDVAVRGETHMYPLLSTGRFLMHIAKFLVGFHDGLLRSNEGGASGGTITKTTTAAATDTLRLASAACNMQSDIHCSPNQMIGAARRYASSYPTAYFQISEDSKEVMKEISEQYVELESKLSKNDRRSSWWKPS